MMTTTRWIRIVTLAIALSSAPAAAQVCTDTINLRCPVGDPSCDTCPAGSPCVITTDALSNVKWNQAATDIALMCLEVDKEPRARTHATDCTGLTDGEAGELCFDLDDDRGWRCEPTAGLCDTVGEWIAVAGTDTNLTQEEVEDFAGALVADGTGTHTGVAVTYQDATGDVDLVVDHDAATNFLAAEHVDWAGASAGTVHATNYVDDDVPDAGEVDDTALAAGAVDGGAGGEIADGTVDGNDIATDGVSADELNATGVEAELEAVLDLPDLQGTLGSAQLTAALLSKTIDAGDAGSGTTRPANGNTIQVLTHDTDCTSLTIGKRGELCCDEDDDSCFRCEPTAGDCDTAGEWIAVGGGGTSISEGDSNVTVTDAGNGQVDFNLDGVLAARFSTDGTDNIFTLTAASAPVGNEFVIDGEGSFSWEIGTGKGFNQILSSHDLYFYAGANWFRWGVSTKILSFPDPGTAAAPIIGIGELTTGFFRPSVGVLGITGGGIAVAHFNTIASGVNRHDFYASATGLPIRWVFTGTDTDGTIDVEPKGAGSFNVVGKLSGDNQAITLGAAATTFAATTSFVTLTGDGGANTLADITGGVVGMPLRLLFVDALITITDTDAHDANTIDLSAAFTSADDTTLTLLFDGTSWYEMSRSVN